MGQTDWLVIEASYGRKIVWNSVKTSDQPLPLTMVM
jgi:hypothetical protein